MSTIQTLPAPLVPAPKISDERWHRERSAFQQLLPQLLKESSGKFVAIYAGQVVACGDNKIEVAQQAYSQCGYVPIYVGHVSTELQSYLRMPTPRPAARQRLNWN